MTVYDKTDWVTHEIIHTADMNHLETGIYTAHNEIQGILDTVIAHDYVDISTAYSNIVIAASSDTEITDIDTLNGHALVVQITKNDGSGSCYVEFFAKVGTAPYTTENIDDIRLLEANLSDMKFLSPPIDKLKIKITNESTELPMTVNLIVRVIGNAGFMTKAVYDADADSNVDVSELAIKANALVNGESVKTYAQIASEIDSDISTHAAIVTAHHTNVNDPTVGQKAALAGSDGTPGADNKYVTNSDSRLTDSRTPTAHEHTCTDVTDIATSYEPIISSKGTAFNKNFGTTSSTVCEGSDSRLSNSRTPSAHAASHKTGQSDVIKLDEFGSPTDNTNLDASITAHGLCPKLGGGTTNFLRADGTWATPPGGTPGGIVFGDEAGEVCEGNDVRLSNERTPLGHKANHYSGGPDAIKLDDFATPDDNTDLNASTTAHGLCPKLSNDTTQFLNGQAGWTVPAGTWASNFGNTAGTICGGNDVRLSNARAPTAHATQHGKASTDPLTLEALGVSDLTTNNTSTTNHGLCPKLTGVTTVYLNGNGAWTTPATSVTYGTTAGTACQGNDARLGNSRYPTAHVDSHYAGSTDPMLAEQLLFADSTAKDTNTYSHGFCPKLNSNVATFLRGDGAWGTPGGIITTFIRWEEGNLGTSISFMPYLCTAVKTITSIKGYVQSLPTGANILIDVRKNSPSLTTASVFASDAAQSIATNLSATNGVYQFNFSAALDAAQVSCAAGDVLYVVVTQVGSTLPGAGFYIEVAF